MNQIVLEMTDDRDGPITLLGDGYFQSGVFTHLHARSKDKKGELFEDVAKLFHKKFIAQNVVFFGHEWDADYKLRVTVQHLAYGGPWNKSWESCKVHVTLINNPTNQQLFGFYVTDRYQGKRKGIASFENFVSHTIENTVKKIIAEPMFQKTLETN
ncbi:MAG: hypothetical protein JXP36_03630 [Bacteroidales bacterium]|nr:hypothetical protein [Bacteroidales bacterium]